MSPSPRRDLDRSQEPSPNMLQRMHGPAIHMVALYDYDPVKLSPNVDAEVLDDNHAALLIYLL